MVVGMYNYNMGDIVGQVINFVGGFEVFEPFEII